MTTNTTAETISLLDFNNDVKSIGYVWICGVGCPTGTDIVNDPEVFGDGHFNALIDEMGLWNLEGTAVGGEWQWNGKGDVRDARGNTIYNVKAH